MNPTIKIKLDAGATMPRYAHPTDVGADVTALRTWIVDADGTEHEIRTLHDFLKLRTWTLAHIAKLKIDTGVHAQPPAGYYIELVPNSRIAKTPFQYANSIGIIDPTYTGSMRVVLNVVNIIITTDDIAQFLPGKVVGQLIVRKQHQATFTQVDTLEATERGSGGFGSTAKLPLDSWHPLPAESGQQSILPPTAGQQTCLARNASDATQSTLSCVDAMQLFNTNGN